MKELWFEPLVWMDYRLAVLFTVIIPIILLIWAFVQKVEAIQRLLIIYWRIASLLIITVYLMIGSTPIGFLSAFFARILIPISLWFWVDLNEEIDDLPQRPLKLTLTAWRWAVTLYTLLGALALIPFIPTCGFSSGGIKTPFCEVWLKAPWLYKQYFHGASTTQFLGFLGFVGLTVYIFYLSYYILVRLGKEGRSAIPQ